MKRIAIPWFAWILVILAGTQALLFASLPMLNQWRPQIEVLLQERLGAEVSISEIGAKASLSGPYLEALNLMVEHPQGRIEVRRVRMVINWWSLITQGRLTLDQLVLDEGRWIATGSSGAAVPDPSQWFSWLNRVQEGLAQTGAVRLNNFEMTLTSASLKRISIEIDPNRGVLGRTRVVTESASLPIQFDWRFSTPAQPDHDLRVSVQSSLPLPSWVDESIQVEGALGAWLIVKEGHVDGLVDAQWASGEGGPAIGGALSAKLSASSANTMDLQVVKGFVRQPGLSMDLAGLIGQWRGGAWALTVPELSVDSGQWAPLLAQPDPKLSRLLNNNRPKAQISGLRIEGAADVPVQWSAVVEGLDVRAGGDIPSIGPLAGKIYGQDTRGFFEFASPSAELSMPDIFPAPWLEQSIQGTLAFSRDESGLFIRGHGLSVQDAHQHVQGDLMLDLPRDREQSLHLELQASASRPALEGLLPIDLEDDVRSFLVKGIEAVEVEGGRISYSGPLGDGVDRTRRTLSLKFPMRSYVLKPLDDWPAFVGQKGQVEWSNRRARVQLDAPEFGGLRASEVVVRQTPDDAERLTIDGMLEGQAEAAVDILAAAGIKPDALGGAVVLSGPLTGQVALTVPVDDGSPMGSVEMQTQGLKVTVDGLNAPIEQVTGSARYVIDQGLSSRNLHGFLMGHPLDIQVASGAQGIDVSASGRLPADSVLSLAGVELEHSLLSGDANWLAQINASEVGVKAVLQTDGRGLESALPAPLTKPADQEGSIVVEIHRQENDSSLSALIFDEVSVKGSLTDTAAGWSIQAPTLDLLGWAQVPNSGNADAAVSLLIDTDQVLIGETALAVDRLAVKVTADELQLSIDGDALAGRVERIGQAPLVIDLERLKLSESGPFLAPPEPDPLESFNPDSLPSIDLSIADLWRGEVRYQDVKMTAVEGVDRLDVTQLAFTRDGQPFVGELAWQYMPEGSTTAISLRSEGQGLGQLLRVNEKEPILEAKRGQFTADLSWTGSPLGFSILTAEGALALALEDGRFVDLGNSAEVLRLFGILNIETLTRRLRLDFLDLVKPGVAFDQVKARARLSGGRLVLDPDLLMDGPSSNFRITGTADLNEKTLNHRLEVDIPLTNNLPLASVLLGAPQVGGAIYLVEKALGTKLIRVGKTNYRIEGSFDQPNIQIIPPFSDQKESSDVDATANDQ